jgi:hypothetical protein
VTLAAALVTGITRFTAAERLFRHKLLTFLLREELIARERVELLSSWKNSGFSVHNLQRAAGGRAKVYQVRQLVQAIDRLLAERQE